MTRLPKDYVERCYAGWLGKIAGVRYGAPIEGWSYDKIAKVFGELDGYVAEYHDFAADDDTNGPAFFMRALEDYNCSENLTAEDIGKTWLNYVPYEHGMFAWGGYGRMTEHTAYMNLRGGIPAPYSGSIAMNGSVTAQQIGGQIFIDCWGFVAPGNPALAAKLAERAASVSHDGEGIYGGIFVAAAIAAAFTCRDIIQVMETALSYIPADSIYAQMYHDVKAFWEKEPADWRACFRFVEKNYGYSCYPGVCHIIPNSAVMVLSMLYGEGNYTRTINICNMCGWDTDCTTGNVGAIMGVLVGLDGLDYEKWLLDIHDFLPASSVMGSQNIMDVPSLTYYTAKLAYRLNQDVPEKKWQDILEGKTPVYNFELPLSTHNFRVEASTGQVWLKNTNRQSNSGERSLHLFASRVEPWDNSVRVYQKTYYESSDFTDSRYDPFFSPIFYPGQTFYGHVMLSEDAKQPFTCYAYAYDKNHTAWIKGDEVRLIPGQWMRLAVQVPRINGGLITRVGFSFEGPSGIGVRDRLELDAFIDDVGFEGKAAYSLDFAMESEDQWKANRRHREITQMSRQNGYWYLEGKELHGSAPDDGEMYTGDASWTDYTLRATMRPVFGRNHQINFRVQGAIRSYAVRLSDNHRLSLVKNEQGYRELASVPFDWKHGTAYTFIIRVESNCMTVSDDTGKQLMCVQDTDHPYLRGAVGMSVTGGGHCAFSNFEID